MIPYFHALFIQRHGMISALMIYGHWRDANNYQQEKNTCFYKIIHFSVQFSAIVNKFIEKT